ncbi:MAG: MBL fold metallo-hydrolase [Microgenomates group bacterium]|jgi:beta-lactamase superfamily II metal-dependent hydrolase|nr:MBL fold metallo-hydrolase [Candidatus Woesebacteria bacterium]MBP6883096.1 MBL fold metallo-hydrolase [Candidatus Woesebacteria bacterium]QQR63972.1 MAG: MBL fold metallo-hydrolase [Candidatus Roizmanbacteria bacterium]
MHDSPVSKTGFISAIIFSLLFSITSYLYGQNNHSFVVFCDVGQGDASYIHIRPNIDILIDAGKGSSVLGCLSKYMSVNDKTIEIAFLSHLQSDHYGGYQYIPLRYKIERLFMNYPKTTSIEALKLLKILKHNKTTIEPIFAGASIQIQAAKFKILWPTEDYVQASSASDDPNNGSQIIVFTFNGHSILYTGDASPKTLKRLLEQSIKKIDILKIPHHGSKNGLINEFLILADPTFSVISVGKNNPYGHPSLEILDMLEKSETNVLRTDVLGDVIFNLD